MPSPLRPLFLALVLLARSATLSPATPPAATAPAPPLGILTRAVDSRIDHAPAAPGLSVFDDDRLSTGPEGRVSVRLASSTIALYDRTIVSLHRLAPGVHIDLERGAIFCNAAPNDPLEVHARDAFFTRLKPQPLVAEFQILDRNLLQVSAITGDLAVSYRGEAHVIPQGQTYRIYLDSDDPPQSASGSGASANTSPSGAPVNSGSHVPAIFSKVSFYVVTGVAAGAAAWGIHQLTESSSSPNAPVSPYKP